MMWGIIPVSTFILVAVIVLGQNLTLADDQPILVEDPSWGQTKGHNGYNRRMRIDVVCKLGQTICGIECYSSTTQSCIKHNICNKNEIAVCGKVCIPNNSKQVCRSNGPEAEFNTLCNPDQEACAGHCYSNRTHVCLEKKYLCVKGEAVCGEACYSSSKKQCLKTQYGSYLCEKNEKACGHRGCYSPKAKVCFESDNKLGHAICDPGHIPCGENCYKLSAGDSCDAGKSQVCKTGTKPCGLECYASPNRVCLESNRLRPVGHSACGSNDCYNSSAEQCMEDRRRFLPCPVGNYKSCDSKCYSPSTHNCLEEPGGQKVICLKGEVLCDESCMKPDSQLQCITGPIRDVLCKSGQALCAITCYDTESKDKVCLDNVSVCLQGEKICGADAVCYNPKSHVCFNFLPPSD